MHRPSAPVLRMGGGGALTLTLLTACPQPPPPSTTTTLNFRFPDTAQTGELKLAAIYFVDGSIAAQPTGVRVLTTWGLTRTEHSLAPAVRSTAALCI